MVLRRCHLIDVIIVKLVVSPIIGLAIIAILRLIVPDIYASNPLLFFFIYIFFFAPTGILLVNVFILAKVYTA